MHEWGWNGKNAFIRMQDMTAKSPVQRNRLKKELKKLSGNYVDITPEKRAAYL